MATEQPNTGEEAPRTGPSFTEQQKVEAKQIEVQRILTDWLGRIEVTREGELSFPVDSTRVFIRVTTFNDATVIAIEAPTNLEVPPSPELFHHIATHTDEWVFGHLSCREEDGHVTVAFSHRILGDHLQPEELKGAVAAVAYTANEIDDQLRQRFGGRLFKHLEEEETDRDETPAQAAAPAPPAEEESEASPPRGVAAALSEGPPGVPTDLPLPAGKDPKLGYL